MHPFGRPAARQTARAPARPVPVPAQPVRPVARRPVLRPLPIPPVHPTVRRPVHTAHVAQVAQAPQRRQPAVVILPVRLTVRHQVPTAPVVRVAPTPQHRQPAVAVPPVHSTVALAPQRRQPVAVVTPFVPEEGCPDRGAFALFWPGFYFARLSHYEAAGQTPALSVVPVPPATQAVDSDVPSTSTSGLGRRARRNRNKRQRRPRPVSAVLTPEVIVAPEIEAIQGGCFSPLKHSGDEEDIARITAAPPATTTLPRARFPRDAGYSSVAETDHEIERQQREPARPQISSVEVAPEQPATSIKPRRSRWVWRRRQAGTPVEPVQSVETVQPDETIQLAEVVQLVEATQLVEIIHLIEAIQPVGIVDPLDVVVPSGSEVVLKTYDIDTGPSPDGSPDRVEIEPAPSPHRITSPMSPYIEALRRSFLEDDDILESELDDNIPVYWTCVITR
ncbi:uncharacterized protein LOC110116365 [Dendrobium catenatum]|uniref:uncharacterized protein LOC110116365 n=1 Tax=Dendrobium catenatum TaxID=906689 RepID=UPI0009F68827|nr:uncharacterized protein LOC110116365 [Dendrobium catenatum]